MSWCGSWLTGAFHVRPEGQSFNVSPHLSAAAGVALVGLEERHGDTSWPVSHPSHCEDRVTMELTFAGRLKMKASLGETESEQSQEIGPLS